MPSSNNPQDWPEDAIPKQWIDSLWQRMLGYYGQQFFYMWEGVDTDSTKKLWAKQMAKLKPEQMRQGVMALETLKRPPTLPEFISLCRISLDPLKAYYEAVNGLQARSLGEIGNWSHPAIFWAAARMSHDLRSSTYSQVKDRWEAMFKDELAKGEWAPIEKPLLAIGTDVKTRINPEAAKAAMDLANKIASGSTDVQRDHKRWARLLIAKANEPDPKVTQIQLDFAKSALNIA